MDSPYLVPVESGVVPAFPGADGFSFPSLFSGVPDFTPVGPDPAVPGLLPSNPEGVTAGFSPVLP